MASIGSKLRQPLIGELLEEKNMRDLEKLNREMS